MASPKFVIDGYEDRKVKESHTTNNRAIADIMVDDFLTRWPLVALSKLARIEQGVAVYEIMKEYEP
jgi:hypothetical protein